MSKAKLETAIRLDVLAALTEFLASHYDTDVLPVSANELAIPQVDAEGNETFALIKVSIPRGTRANGTFLPYDGYQMAEQYKEEVAIAEANAAVKQAEAAAKTRLKEQRQEAKRKKAEMQKALIQKEKD